MPDPFPVDAGSPENGLPPTSNIKSGVRTFARLLATGSSVTAPATSAGQAGVTAKVALRESSFTTLGWIGEGVWFVLHLLC